MSRILTLGLPALLCALCLGLPACGGSSPQGQLPPDDMPADDTPEQTPDPEAGPTLLAVSDEFEDPATLSDWSRVYQVEGWGFDQLESADIGTTEPGALSLMPYASSWFEEWRGVLMFKLLTGDFIATTHVRVSNRADTGPPSSQYSLGGIMVRAPRAITPATWTPDGEDYVFHSMGAADTPGTWQTEVKTTDDSDSVLQIAAGGPEATLRSVRIGPHMILLLRWPGQEWQIHRRYRRDDFPATLQVGFTTYTDWPTCQAAGVQTHNTTLLAGGNPDLIARFDYMRFHEPVVPAALVGADLSNPGVVDDATLLAFLDFD